MWNIPSTVARTSLSPLYWFYSAAALTGCPQFASERFSAVNQQLMTSLRLMADCRNLTRFSAAQIDMPDGFRVGSTPISSDCATGVKLLAADAGEPDILRCCRSQPVPSRFDWPASAFQLGAAVKVFHKQSRPVLSMAYSNSALLAPGAAVVTDGFRLLNAHSTRSLAVIRQCPHWVATTAQLTAAMANNMTRFTTGEDHAQLATRDGDHRVIRSCQHRQSSISGNGFTLVKFACRSEWALDWQIEAIDLDFFRDRAAFRATGAFCSIAPRLQRNGE